MCVYRVSEVMTFPSIIKHFLASETQEESIFFRKNKQKNRNTERLENIRQYGFKISSLPY